MGGYKPLSITAPETGLVQERQEFILPNDAYPVLENAFVWRERTKRKQGAEILGRLRRQFIATPYFPVPSSPWTFNLLAITGYITAANNANPGEVTTLNPHNLSNGDQVKISGVLGATGYNSTFTITVTGTNTFTVGVDAAAFGAYLSGGFFYSNNNANFVAIEPASQIEVGSVSINIDGTTLIDQGNGILQTNPVSANTGTINYRTGAVSITYTGATPGTTTLVTYNYFPGLPVMGLRTRELNNINAEQTIGFDTRYAYNFSSGWQEFIAGTIWTGTNSDFFWTTNYWVDGPVTNRKVFWVTNFSTSDPIRYTNGSAWADFAPQITATPTYLYKALCILPFRGRLLAFNTFEGATFGASVNQRQRIRWCAIGTPFTATSSVVSGGVNVNAWRDDIRGQGGFLDIPTSQDIISVGYVRDNLVIYCESSTWQLRYTGRSISPFQIEKVNTELGAESTFSAVQFDTSLVGVGDKGVVECDSFKSERIDIKIPDLIFQFNNQNNGLKRVYGVRDFVQRLAYWTYPYIPNSKQSNTFPNRRLVYNYENGSWAIFTDSITAFGTFQPTNSRTWASSNFSWQSANFSWINKPAGIPDIVGGNQQGYVFYLDSKTTNDPLFSIDGVSGNTPNVTVITSNNHNLETGQIIEVSSITPLDPFVSLNDGIFYVNVLTSNTFTIFSYNPVSQFFDIPNVLPSGTYLGGGKFAVRDNFKIRTKQFNFLDDAENIQLGQFDILMDKTESGAISCYVYTDYNTNTAVNTLPQNQDPQTNLPDTFFNSVILTTTTGGINGSKGWQKIYCPTRAAFITLEFTLSNAQMAGVEQENDVQIDCLILYIRKAGRLQTGGI